MVNAAAVAENRGIIITEAKRCEAKGYKNLIKIDVKSEDSQMSIEGIFVGEPKIVMDNFKSFEKLLLILKFNFLKFHFKSTIP